MELRLNNNGRTCSTINGTHPNMTNLEELDMTPNVDRHIPLPPIKIKSLETNHKASVSISMSHSEVKKEFV